MKRRPKKRSLFSLRSYGIFFLLVAVPVTCCLLLFLQDSGIPEEVIRARAPITFANVLLLGALCTAIDGLRRRITFERPVKRILEGTQRLRRGEFEHRIPLTHPHGRQNELDTIIHDLNLMAAELGSIETLRTDFIANVSHELKAPLALIQNYAALLQEPGLDTEQRSAYARAITDASRRLSDLIRNILRLNKLENQQIFPQKQRFNLSEQLCACLLDFESLWEQKQLDIQTQLEEDVFVCSDPELLQLVWSNLFSNAVKFTPEGGRITLQLRTEGDQAVVSVADTGCGFGREVGQHIFEKFYQGDRSHTTQGNGLGLALVRRVVDITGASIRVESEAGRGSCFTVCLPRRMDA